MPRVIPHRPEEASYQYHYETSVTTSLSGKEYRRSVSQDVPMRSIQYGYRLDDEQSAIQEIGLIRNFNEELIVPSFIDEENTFEPIVNRVIKGIRYVNNGQRIAVISPPDADGNSYYHITTVEKTSIIGGFNITITDDIPASIAQHFGLGTAVVPVMNYAIIDDPIMSRFPVEFADFSLDLRSTEFEEVSGKNSFRQWNGLPLIEMEPTNDDLVEDIYSNANEVIQYREAGRFDVFSQRLFPTKQRQLEFQFQDRITWEKWKAFMRTVMGRYGEFYIPTYRNDLQFQPTKTGGNIIGLKQLGEFDDNGGIWQKWPNEQAVFLDYGQPSISTFKSEAIRVFAPSFDMGVRVDIGANPLPEELRTLATEDVKVGFLEKVRLASDVIESSFDGNIYRVFIEVITVNDEVSPIEVRIDLGHLRQFSDDFDNNFS